MSIKIVIVGGFLGAGKTTLLLSLCKYPILSDKKVGVITNDQAAQLVDTTLFSRTNTVSAVTEVSGSCFCCNFSGFVNAFENLEKQGVELVLAEPVGSCTDLSATILQPLKRFYPTYPLSPFSVLIDPIRLPEVFKTKNSLVDSDALYIIERQMGEADILVVNKSDTLSSSEQNAIRQQLADHYPDKPLFFISAQTGDNVENWLNYVLNETTTPAGKITVEINYDRYAHGEAVLGWLNCTALPNWKKEIPPQMYLETFFTELRKKLESEKLEIGHVKASLAMKDTLYIANLTRLDGDISFRTFKITPEKNDTTTNNLLTINARIQMPPEKLESLVRELLASVLHQSVVMTIMELRSLMPGRPNPTHRIQILKS